MVTVPDKGRVLTPYSLTSLQEDRLAAVSSSGRLLVIPARVLPVLPRGKGLKIMDIPTKKFKSGEEHVVSMVVVDKGCNLVIQSGQRKMTIKAEELDAYSGERGRRGSLLPRGYRNVNSLWVEQG